MVTSGVTGMWDGAGGLRSRSKKQHILGIRIVNTKPQSVAVVNRTRFLQYPVVLGANLSLSSRDVRRRYCVVLQRQHESP